MNLFKRPSFKNMTVLVDSPTNEIFTKHVCLCMCVCGGGGGGKGGRDKLRFTPTKRVVN